MTYSMAMVILRSAPHSSTWLHQLLVANLGTLRDTVFSFWCNFQPCYVVLNIKKTRLKFYCNCWCPRCKKAFWKNSSPWTLTSKVNIWLGNHFFLSLRWGFNHFRCWKFFLVGHHPPLPLPILDLQSWTKLLRKSYTWTAFFLNIVAVPVLPSPPSPESNVVMYSKESLNPGRL